jgi:Uma2 family endonuclease
MATTRLLTLAEFEAMGEKADEIEVIDGLAVERETMGRPHGRIGFELGFFLARHVIPNRLGELYTSDTNFVLGDDPLVVVKPDVAFVRADRLPPETEDEGYLTVGPDIVVEVVLPSDRPSGVMTKIERYRQAGGPLIWLVWPRRRTITVYAGGREPRILGEHDVLDGGDVLPDFRLPLSELFQ